MQQEPLIKPHWKIVILDVILRTSYLVFVFFLTPLDVSDFLFFPLRGPWDLSQAVRGWPRLTSILIWSCSLRCERWWGYLTEPSSPTMSVPSGVCPSWWPPPGQRLRCSPWDPAHPCSGHHGHSQHYHTLAWAAPLPSSPPTIASAV